MTMKWLSLLATLAVSLAGAACAPVLDKRLMHEGDRTVSFADLRKTPGLSVGKLFILGGIIVRTNLREEGTVIEALQVPVDSYGYFEESGRSEGRFLAFLPKEQGMLDPAVYHRGRRITAAAEFVRTQSGKIDEMAYVYPVFRIRQIYLWPRDVIYAYPPYYYYDPWFYPYPYPYYYRNPWWSHPRPRYDRQEPARQ